MPFFTRKVDKDGLYRRWDGSLGCVELPPEQQASWVEVPDHLKRSKNKDEKHCSRENPPAYNNDRNSPSYDEKAGNDKAGEKTGKEEV